MSTIGRFMVTTKTYTTTERIMFDTTPRKETYLVRIRNSRAINGRNHDRMNGIVVMSSGIRAAMKSTFQCVCNVNSRDCNHISMNRYE